MRQAIDVSTEQDAAAKSMEAEAGTAFTGASADSPEPLHPGRPDWVFFALSFTAVFYAIFAGLRTVGDFDLGWQLATGRYVLQHHAIPSVDVFSYTATGKPWIYPPFGGVVLYLVWCVGGFAALSLLSAAACTVTTLAITRQRSRAAAFLALIAVPAVAFRTDPRSEMFTTILFTIFLLILWRHYDSHKPALWILPLAMITWVNLHPGFIAGLAVIGAYLLVELCDLPFVERRAAVLIRLRRAGPWLVATAFATLLNPWGWRIYRAILLQNSAMELHSRFIGEWMHVHFSTASWLQALSLRDPASADWWILVAAVVAIAVTIARKEIGPALVLSVGIYESLEHLRMQGLFAVLVCIVGATVLMRATRHAEITSLPNDDASVWIRGGAFVKGASAKRFAEWGLVLLIGAFAVVRVVDLITDRYYLYSDQISLFGAGESWWFPESAANFLISENLPANVFSDYNLGGFLTWRIGPNYPDYFDGRFLPFGEGLFAHHAELLAAELDSPVWQAEADTRNIQTAIFSTARFGGLGNFPLAEDCKSRKWTAVYLDQVAAIFVRNTPKNAALIRQLAISCASAKIAPVEITSASNSHAAQARRFEALMNRASIFYVLQRDQEAYADLAAAQSIFNADPDLHLLKAQLDQADGKPSDAVYEYRQSLNLRPTDSAWFALAQLYAGQKDYDSALSALRASIALSDEDYDRYRALGRLYLLMNQPAKALNAFQQAEHRSPFGRIPNMAADFKARVAEGEAAAYKSLGDFEDAVAEQRASVTLAPDNATRWQELSDIYAAAGDSAEAADARRRAEQLNRLNVADSGK